MKKTEITLFALLMVVLIPLEIGCAYLAYETIGEVISTLYFLAVGVNLLFIIMVARFPTLAGVGAIVLALLIVPYQLGLGHRLLRLQAEAARTMVYLYEYKMQTGVYPPDLPSYTFADPTLQPYFQEYRPDERGTSFILAYYVGAPATSHIFSPENGWSYYPD